MGCSPEDLPEAMNYRVKWRERVRDICASGTTCDDETIKKVSYLWTICHSIKFVGCGIKSTYFYLISLFNGFSMFMGYLMQKPPFAEEKK